MHTLHALQMSDREVLHLHRPAVRPLAIGAAAALLGFATLAIVVTATGGIDGLDLLVSQYVEAHRSGTGLALALVATTLGSYQFVIVATALVAVIAMVQSRRLLEPITLLVSAPFTASLVFLIKLALARQRPPSAFLLGENPTDFSFPSGHTSSGTVLFLLSTFVISAPVTRAAVRRILRIAGVVVAVLIGCSRVYLGYHWTTDVMAGWCLATAVVCLVLIMLRAVNSLRTTDPVADAAVDLTGQPHGDLLRPDLGVGTPPSSEVAASSLWARI